MEKTNEIIKIGTRHVFKFKLDYSELYLMYFYGFASKAFLKKALINPDILDKLAFETGVKRLNKESALQYLLEYHKEKKDFIYKDLLKFSRGEIDVYDFSVKYGMSHVILKKFLLLMLPDVDVNTLYKKQQKFAQARTTMALYGVHHTSVIPEVRAKRDKTTLERYGVVNAMHNEDVVKKLKSTMLDKYGKECNLSLRDANRNWAKYLLDILLSDSVWYDVLHNIADKINVKISDDFLLIDFPVHRRDFKLSVKISDNIDNLFNTYKNISGKSVIYPDNIIFSAVGKIDTSFLEHYYNLGLISVDDKYLYRMLSSSEMMLKPYFDSWGVIYETKNRRLLDNHELDFYFPTLNTALEINPSFTHNSNKYALERTNYLKPKKNAYHFNKYKECSSKGIKLLQLYDWDFTSEKFLSVTIPRLKQALLGFERKFYARKLVFEWSDDFDNYKNFVNKYHNQGYVNSESYIFIKYDDELIGVAGFGKKFGSGYELKRLCYKHGVQIVGGIGKVVSMFFNKYINETKLFSFSDNDIGDGNGYAKAGAKFIRESGESLRFVSFTNPLDTYSWSIATKWGAKSGVIGKDCLKKNISLLTDLDNINEYVERNLSHRFDDDCGYDRIYTSGSKLWCFYR